MSLAVPLMKSNYDLYGHKRATESQASRLAIQRLRQHAAVKASRIRRQSAPTLTFQKSVPELSKRSMTISSSSPRRTTTGSPKKESAIADHNRSVVFSTDRRQYLRRRSSLQTPQLDNIDEVSDVSNRESEVEDDDTDTEYYVDAPELPTPTDDDSRTMSSGGTLSKQTSLEPDPDMDICTPASTTVVSTTSPHTLTNQHSVISQSSERRVRFSMIDSSASSQTSGKTTPPQEEQANLLCWQRLTRCVHLRQDTNHNEQYTTHKQRRMQKNTSKQQPEDKRGLFTGFLPKWIH